MHTSERPPFSSPICEAALGRAATSHASEEAGKWRSCASGRSLLMLYETREIRISSAEHITVLNTRAASQVNTTQSMVQRRVSVVFWSLGLLARVSP